MNNVLQYGTKRAHRLRRRILACIIIVGVGCIGYLSHIHGAKWWRQATGAYWLYRCKTYEESKSRYVLVYNWPEKEQSLFGEGVGYERYATPYGLPSSYVYFFSRCWRKYDCEYRGDQYPSDPPGIVLCHSFNRSGKTLLVVVEVRPDDFGGISFSGEVDECIDKCTIKRTLNFIHDDAETGVWKVAGADRKQIIAVSSATLGGNQADFTIPVRVGAKTIMISGVVREDGEVYLGPMATP